ncbi:hydroxypyruvate isomerase [Magnetovibrio blakemorei]|uniref:Hydroxypyruvate isomerase n=1 Tax=Magnetovibrio blakemorei TaxID=28181 RepID=A0A1E5Q7E3_9PROT|nr:hydroxypyruvate isomerase [Magnetovibrio blakemorei]OEJ67011.1 hydroxypyruvate isomerase [Magnetovibrio blakemorei]
MPKLAANISLMFTEADFADRFALAAQAGFRGVECQFPYDFDEGVLSTRLRSSGLAQVLINLPAGNWQAGDRGIACLPDRRTEFKASVVQGLRYAAALACPQVHVMAGIVPEGLAFDEARNVYMDNLVFAADSFKAEGIRLLIEPINNHDVPGYFLTGTRQAFDIIAATGSDNIALQYDVYHMHIMEGDVAETIKRHLAAIAHVQISDSPGRHEPGTGEIDYPTLLGALDALGYDGWVGCEYVPATSTQDGLGWAQAYLNG